MFGLHDLIVITAIAKVTHEANRAYCETLGDYSHFEWACTPQWQRESAINGVIFHINHPGATPKASHENWMKEKLADGWKHGFVKDGDRKEHPSLVPYDHLPAEQQVKDSIFANIVNAFVAYL